MADKKVKTDKANPKAAKIGEKVCKVGEVTAANIGIECQEANDLIQRTLIIFKPDAVQRGIVGEILSRFERVGLKIVATKMANPSTDHYYHHYESISKMISRRGQEAFDQTVHFMTSGPVIAMVLEGVEAVPLVRKIVGSTEPMAADMGTIRGDYAHMSFGYANARHTGVPNLIHASGNPEEAKAEVEYWFKPEEIQTYQTLAEKYTR